MTKSIALTGAPYVVTVSANSVTAMNPDDASRKAAFGRTLRSGEIASPDCTVLVLMGVSIWTARRTVRSDPLERFLGQSVAVWGLWGRYDSQLLQRHLGVRLSIQARQELF